MQIILPIKYLGLRDDYSGITSKNKMDNISVAVVEDIKDIANELQEIINQEKDLECKKVYFNAEEAITFLSKSPVDLVLIDIGLPGISGIEAIVKLKATHPQMEFCMFTVFEDDEKIYKSITAGAKGYILKNASPSVIVNSLRELKNGGSPINPIIARKILNAFNKNTQPKTQDLPLSKRETQILELLSTGLLYKEISFELGITVGTVKQHIHKIYDKLQVNNKTEAINLFLNR